MQSEVMARVVTRPDLRKSKHLYLNATASKKRNALSGNHCQATSLADRKILRGINKMQKLQFLFSFLILNVMSSKNESHFRFEAYMMTGDLMLNLSRTQQSTCLLPKYQKKVDSLRYNNHHSHHRHNHHNHHHHNSVPTSPNEILGHHRTYKVTGSNSATTSPVGTARRESIQCSPACESKANANFGYSSGFVRTSRSEDHLQFQKDPSMSAVDIDIDDDVTSSLNTLLDTRPESGQGLSSERIVWTYNAPVSSPSVSERTSCCRNGSSPPQSSSSSSSTSPQRSLSPASPTSVSSSVMSSNSGSRRFPLPVVPGAQLGPSGEGTSPAGFHPTNGDLSQSEAISNMSSPDYNDEETMDILSARDIMMVSDPSDSDSTILASEPPQRRLKSGSYSASQESSEYRIVIQVKGPEKESARNSSPRQNKRRANSSNGEIQQQNPRNGSGNNNSLAEATGYQVSLVSLKAISHY